jgi:hypothetical protein
MRRKLGKEEGVRKKFTAVFSRTGKKTNFKGYSEDTLLLIDVKDALTNEPVCDHIWFTYSRTFDEARLRVGMKISFEARVKSYTKGYVNKALAVDRKTTDYKLSHPTKVVVIGE